jgi:hypothetical protein
VGAPRVEVAYWAPDRGTPYQWFEGAKDLQSFFTADYHAAGALYAYIRNDSGEPLSAEGFELDGRPLDELRTAYRVIWWRLLPDPVPPGGVGEVTVRLRAPLAQSAKLRVKLSGGQSVETTIAPPPPPLRIETVGFTPKRDTVFLVVEALDRKPHRLARVFLDGREVTAKCRRLDPSFTTGISPVSIRLPEPLAEGSYHVYQIEGEAGERAGCCVRTYDGWVPLGSYGYGQYEEYARNGCNGYNNFGRASQGELNAQATLLMRGVNIIGDGPPSEYMIGHPGLFAYCLMDEPDCQDYAGAQDWPAEMRIGYHAMELERRCRVCRERDPRKPTMLTVDLTYKPADFYVYGPLADVTNVDCYTRAIGADLKMVREVVETARYGAGPHPLTFTFEGYFPDPDDKAQLAKRRFPRPPLAEETRLSIYYALGSGARGLWNYIHCTEKSGDLTSRGTNDTPDLWREIGRCYREIGAVAPLVALAHPTKLATCDDEKVWLRTLVAGEEALLVVCANDDYREEATAFRYTPKRNVTVRLPAVPWLKPQAAWWVTEEGMSPLPLTTVGAGTEVRLDRLDVAGMVLVSSDAARAERLTRAQEQHEAAVSAALLKEWRIRQDAEATYAHTVRRLTGEFADRAVMGTLIAAYGVQPPRYWNPAQETYWALEFGQNDAGPAPDSGAQWTIEVAPENVGKPCSIYAICGTWGRPGTFSLVSPEGKELLTQSISGGMEGQLVRLRATFPTAGGYRLTFLLKGPGPKGGRVAHVIYVVPDEMNPPDVP